MSDLDPLAMSLGTGASFMGLWKEDKSMFESMLANIYEQTMLSNFNELLEYNKTIHGALGSVLESYMSQYIPTILRNVSRVFTNSKQTQKSSSFRFLQNIIDATPFRAFLPDQIDPYTGQTRKRFATGFIGELFNIANPVQVRYRSKSVLEREANELDAKLGKPTGSFTINEDEIKVQGKDFEVYQKKRAAYISSESAKLIETAKYKQMTNDEKTSRVAGAISRRH